MMNGDTDPKMCRNFSKFSYTINFCCNFLKFTTEKCFIKVQNELQTLKTLIRLPLIWVCIIIPPLKLCLWEGILFSRCPSERPTDRPNVRP